MTNSFCNVCPCDEKCLETPVFPPRRPPHVLTRPSARSSTRSKAGQHAGAEGRPGRAPAPREAAPPPRASAYPEPRQRAAAPAETPSQPSRASRRGLGQRRAAPGPAAGSLRSEPADSERTGGPGAAGEAPPRRGSPGAARPRGPYLEVDGRQLHGSSPPACPPRDSGRRSRLTRGWAKPRRSHRLPAGRPGEGGGAGGAGTPPRRAPRGVPPRPAGPRPTAAPLPRGVLGRWRHLPGSGGMGKPGPCPEPSLPPQQLRHGGSGARRCGQGGERWFLVRRPYSRRGNSLDAPATWGVLHSTCFQNRKPLLGQKCTWMSSLTPSTQPNSLSCYFRA